VERAATSVPNLAAHRRSRAEHLLRRATARLDVESKTDVQSTAARIQGRGANFNIASRRRAYWST
jgi:hypothetical protein